MLYSEVKSLSRVRLFATPWTVAYQASLSMGFSSQEYWSGLPFPSPGDLPDPRIEPRSPTLQADTLPSEPPLSILYSNVYISSTYKKVCVIGCGFPFFPPAHSFSIGFFLALMHRCFNKWISVRLF